MYLHPVMFVDVTSKSPAICANMTTIGAGMLDFLQMTSFNVFLHVLLCFANVLTISASEFAPTHCHNLGVH